MPTLVTESVPEALPEGLVEQLSEGLRVPDPGLWENEGETEWERVRVEVYDGVLDWEFGTDHVRVLVPEVEGVRLSAFETEAENVREALVDDV